MELAIFAIDNGYAEGIIRGFRASFFSEAQYTQIKNCSNLEELKSVSFILIPVPRRLRLWNIPSN